LPAADFDDDRPRYREQLVAAVREAGQLALGKFGAPLKIWNKIGDSPVTEVDIAVNEFLQERLRDRSGRIGWLSEETEDDSERLKARRIWIIDPIDGTRAFIGGGPDWSIAAALTEDGRPTIAVIYAPAEDEMFVAVAGKGATRNGAPIMTSDGEMAGARIAGPPGYLRRLEEVAPPFVTLPRIRSLALRFALVAYGSVDAAFASRNAHDWDLAAADLLVHEAGGALTNFAGQLLTYNQAETTHPPLIAAGQRRHAALKTLMQEHPISR
jgi:myo-inositol-1(or 4)-monophosphatase